MSAKKSAAKTAKVEKDIESAEQIGDGVGLDGQALTVSSMPKAKVGKPQRKAKKDQAIDEDRESLADAEGEGGADSNAIVLAQAATVASDAVNAAGGAGEQAAGTEGAGGASAASSSSVLPAQSIATDTGASAAGAASPMAGADAGGAAGAETAVVASGFSPIMALPLLALGGGGGGGGGGSSSANTPPAATTPPVDTPPPPVDTTPPVDTPPPVDTTPPVDTPPPVDTTPPVDTPPPEVPVLSGTVADGYVAGAQIYIDVNGDGNPDIAEDTGVATDATGHFSAPTSLQGPIIAVGGTNIDTGLPNTLILMAPVGSTVVNPLTTLIQQYINSKGVSAAQAETAIEAMLVLPNVDMGNYDPLAVADPVDATALAVQKAAAQLAVLMTLADEFSAGSATVMMQSLIDLIDAGQTVNLASAATLNAINAGAGGLLDATQIATIAAGTSAVAQTTTLASAEANSVSQLQQQILDGINDAAVLSSAAQVLDETDAPLATGGTLTISDVDSPVAFVAQTGTAGTNGTFSVDAAGNWTYTANSAFDNLGVGESVSDTFTVAAADGTTTSVQVTINGTNDAAILSSAVAALDETNAVLSTSGQLTISDVDSPATFVAQTGTAGTNGTFSVDAAGAWTYTANSAFDNLSVGGSVSDSFTVASADGTTTSVQVTISGTNDAAVLSSAVAVLDETNAALSASGQLTISDVDSAATFVAQTDVAGVNGTFSVDAAGAWIYTANSAFDNLNVGDSVSDTFTVASADGTTTSVQVTINGTNDAALLSAAVVALDETNATLATGGTLTNSDADNPAGTFVAQTGVAGVNGNFSVDAAGNWTYTANSAFDNLNVGASVSDSFTVQTTDGTTTSVQVTINGTNDAAILSAAVAALDETDAALSTSGQLTISDVDSAAAFVAQTDVAGANGIFSVDAAGSWTYTANSAFDNLSVGASVSDTFTVASADGTQTSVQVTINGTNDAAILSSAVVALDETDAPLTTGGTLTISDVDSPAAFVAQTDVAGVNGSFSIDATGNWSYTANSAFDALNVGDSVSDSFTVASADGTTTSVQVTINGTNDAAILSAAVVALDETDAALGTSGQLTVSDVDSAATFVAQTNVAGANGTFSVDAAGAWTYTANSAFDNLGVGESVSDTFTVASADGTTTSVQVTMNGTNDAAILSSAVAALDETDAALSTSGQLTISDVDSAATFVAQTDVAGVNGTFSVDAAGAWIYTANSAFDNLNVGESVSDTFTVASADGTTTSVQVTINGTDDAAILSAEVAALDETDAPLSTSGQLTISDVDSAATFVAQTDVAGANGTFSVDAAGAWTYTANSAFDELNVGESVSDTFTVASADGTTTSVQVTINGTNDAAILSAEVVALDETDAVLSTSGQLTISDVDSANAFVAQTDVAGVNGSFSVDAAGAWTYTANSAFDNLNVGESVSDTFTVASADGTTTSVQVTINGTNDAAVLSAEVVALDETNAALSTSGQLTISDVDSANAFVAQTDVAGVNGSFSVDAAGAWTYTANSAFDNLNVGASVSDSFTVASADGTTTSVQVTINGTNDAAILSAEVVALDETNAALSTSGQLTISDVDSANAFVAQTDVAGANGSFSVDATGAWTYTANSAFDELNVGESVSDSFTVASADGTTTSVQVTINGTNDAAVLSSATAQRIEGNTVAAISASGTLSITDVDSPAVYVPQIDTVGTYGSFSIDEAGAWTYTASSAHNEFEAGTTYTDTFTVQSADGTSTSVVVSILGTLNAAEGGATVNLDEADTAAAISASGQLINTEAFVVQSGTVGAFGSFSIAADGTWSYTADSAHDELAAGQVVSETFAVDRADGTATNVVINILGTNDAAILSAAVVALDETDAALSTGGQLTISDVDSANAFVAQTDVAGVNGTFSVDAAGAWTYTANSAFDELNVGESVSDSFTVASADGTQTSVQVTINGTNDAAILSAEVVVLDETDAVLSTSGQLTISDVDSANAFVAQTDVAGVNGTFSVDAAGAWTYTANSAFDELNVGDSVSDTFTVASADGTTTSVQVTISGTNDAAILSSEVVALDETDAVLSASGQLTISDVDSANAFVAQTDVAGVNGTFSVDAAGAWTYTANSAFDELNVGDSVSDTFTVASADGTQTSVQVTINGTNDAAILSAEVVVLDETDAVLSTSGQLTISDVDSANAFVAQTDVAGVNGTFSVDAAGAWTYTANSAFDELNVGESVFDTFTVEAADGTQTSVQVAINGTNDAAILSSEVVALDETDATLSASGQLTISDVDSANEFVAQTDVAGANGTFSVDALGNWTYTANSAFDELNVGESVSDSFTVASADGTQTSVQVTINGTNDAAILSSEVAALDETDAVLSTSGQLTISDVDSANEFVAQTDVAGVNGTFSVDALGNWIYTANSAFDELNVGDSVSDTFTVASADGTQTSVQVTINGTNDAAILSAEVVALDETDAVLSTSGQLTISDVDSANAFVAQTDVAGVNGIFSVDAAGAWTYTANSAFDELNVGESVFDTFTVEAADGTTTSVLVAINGTNDAAILSSEVVALDETDATLSASGQLTISDVDSANEFVAQTDVAGANGTFSVDALGNWTYTANSAFDNLNVGDSVSDSFTVASADGTTTSVQVTINGTNDAAILSAAVVALDETDAVLSTSGQLTISDVDSANAFVAQTDVAGVNGTFSVDAAGAWTYTANSAFDELNVGESVFDTFTVEAADGTQTSVQVAINGTNDAAILSSEVVALDETDAVLSASGQLTISDADSANEFVAQTDVAGVNGVFSVDALGNWTYTANSAFDELNVGDSVSDTFTVASADGTTTSVQVTINGTNDAAILSSEVVALDETDVVLSASGQLTISDVDSANAFVAQTDVAGANGTFSVDALGNWTYTANSAFDELNVGDSVFDTFTVEAADGTTTSVQVTINGTNDAAILSSEVVALNETNAPLTTSGQLTISDVDSANEFVAQTDVAGVNGTFSVDAAGNWTYTANSAFDELNVGDSVSDTFTVATADGTTTSVQVTINGTKEEITVAEAGALLALDPGATYGLADTAENLAAASAQVGTNALFIRATTPATVAEAAAIVLLPTGGTITYSLEDTAANLAAATVAIGDGAVDITVTDQATVAEATVIDDFLNSGLNNYSLTDTAANLAAATLAVGNGATDITASDAATVAEATAIESFVNSGVTSYSITDTAAELAAASAAVGDGATDITVTDAATVAEATVIEGFANSGVTSYSLADTAAELAAASPAVGDGATDITVTDVATVAEATVIEGFANSGVTSYSLADTAANLAAASLAVGNGATDITALDAATVAEATIIEGFTNSGATSYSVADTAANLAAASPGVLGGALIVIATDALTVAEADALLAANASSSFALSDTAANLAAASAAVGNSATDITAIDAATVAEATIIEGFTNSGTTTYDVVDSAAAIAAANVAGVETAAISGAVSVTASDAATAAEADIIAAYTTAVVYSVSDTAAALSGATAGGLNEAVDLVATTAATVAEATVIEAATNSGTTTYSLTDTAANLAAASAAVGDGATDIIVTDSATVAEAAVIDAFTNSGVTSYSLTDTAAALLDPLVAATVSGATSVAVLDALTVADANLLLALNPNTSYDLSDLSFSLLEPLDAATVAGATTVTVSDAVLAVDASALLLLNANTTYDLSDTAAELLAAAPAVVSGAASVTVSDAVTVAEAETLLALNPTAAYALFDTAANMATASAAVGQGTLFAVVTTPTTVAEATVIMTVFNGASVSYDLSDTAANLLALDAEATVIGALSLTVQDPVSVADADALLALNFATTYDLSDTSANVLALDAEATVIGALSLTVLDAVLVADADWLLVLNANTTYSLADTAAALLDPLESATVSGATSVAVVDAISVADANALLALNANTSYSLSDFSLALLEPLDAATVAGATTVNVIDIVSVVDASALLALNANTTYEIWDFAAALLEPLDAAAVSAATTIVVLDFVSVADANALVALNAGTSYDLSDTSANLLAPADAATVTNAFSVAVQDPVSVADANAVLALNGFTTYDLSDTAANLLAADAVTVGGALSVQVVDAVAVADADALLALNFFVSYSLSDTAAALLDPLANATVTGATAVAVLDSVTVADANALLALNANTTYSLSDSAAALLALGDAATVTGATTVTVLDAVSVADAEALLALNANTAYDLTDTAAALSAASEAVLTGATSITATDAVTVAQADAMLALNPNAIYALADTASNLAAASAALGDGAIDITATTPATVAEATVIDAFANSGTTSYSLSDTASELAAASAAVGDGAIDITTTSPATVAEATIIDAFTNSGTTSYSLSDSLANLLDVGAAALVAGAIDVTVNEPVTVAEANALVALNPNTFYGLLDTAANLLVAGDAGTVTGAQSVTVTGPAISVADAGALLALNAQTTGYDLSDTAANLLFPLDVALLSAATSVTVTDSLTVAEFAALQAVLGPSAPLNYSLTDTGADLLAAPVATIQGAQSVTVSDSLLAADATTLLAELSPTATMNYSLADISANLLAPTEAAAVSGATSVNVLDDVTVVDAGLLLALNPNTSYSLADTAANLLALAASSLVIGAISVAVSDSVTVAEAEALLALNLNSTYPLIDTVANLSASSPAVQSGALFVITSDQATVAQANALLLLNPNTLYGLADTAVNLLAPGEEGLVMAAQSITVTGPAISVADADFLIALNFQIAYNLSDTAAALLDPLEEITVIDALSVTVTGPAITVAEVGSLLALNAQTSGYGLADTAANLVADPTLLSIATSVTVTDTATLAQATIIHDAAPTALYTITDASATVASALSTGSADFATVQAATEVGVTGIGSMLTLDSDQFSNLQVGPFLAADDTIAIDGLESVNLGVLPFFGGDVVLGMTLGGAQNGSYIVDMGTSGEQIITMEGLGQHDITAASDLTETFIVGITSIGGSTIRNLEAGVRADKIDVAGAGNPHLDELARVTTGAEVDLEGEWAFDGGVLTWFDPGHAAAEFLTIQLAAGATDLQLLNAQRFEVI